MVKVKLIVFVLCSLIADVSLGQKKAVFAGLQGGLSVSNGTGIEPGYLYFENTQVLISPSFNVYFQYGLTDALSVNLGVGFERKGFEKTLIASDSNRNPIGEFASKQVFNYLIIPMNIEYQWGGKIKYFIGFGGYIGFLGSQTFILEGFGNFQGSEESQKDYYHLTDYGLSAEAGCIIPIKESLSLTVRINGNLGLKNIVKKPTVFYDKASLNSLTGLVGLRYELNKKK